MKKPYEMPEIRITVFDPHDVIATSDGSAGENLGEWDMDK